jgi:hypothetical protein
MDLFGASLRLTPSGLTRKFAPGEFFDPAGVQTHLSCVGIRDTGEICRLALAILEVYSA